MLGGHFLHTQPKFALGPGEGFAVPLSFTRESFITPMELRHWGSRCYLAPVNNTFSLRTWLAFYTVLNSSISSADVSALTIKEPRLKKLCNLIKTSQIVSNGVLPWTKSASLVSNLFQICYLQCELYNTPQPSSQSHFSNYVCCDLLSYVIKTSLLWSLSQTVQEALTPQINQTNSFL